MSLITCALIGGSCLKSYVRQFTVHLIADVRCSMKAEKVWIISRLEVCFLTLKLQIGQRG